MRLKVMIKLKVPAGYGSPSFAESGRHVHGSKGEAVSTPRSAWHNSKVKPAVVIQLSLLDV